MTNSDLPAAPSLTKHREAVLSVLTAGHVHLTAQDVHDALRARAPEMALATVYRSLHALEKRGLVRAVDAGTSAKRYEAVRSVHAHIRCTICGRIEDLALPEPESLDRVARQQTGFDVHGHDVVFEGICPDCKTKAPQT